MFLPGNPTKVNFLSIFSFFILEPALWTSVMCLVSLNNVGAVTISFCVPKLALAYLLSQGSDQDHCGIF